MSAFVTSKNSDRRVAYLAAYLLCWTGRVFGGSFAAALGGRRLRVGVESRERCASLRVHPFTEERKNKESKTHEKQGKKHGLADARSKGKCTCGGENIQSDRLCLADARERGPAIAAQRAMYLQIA